VKPRTRREQLPDGKLGIRSVQRAGFSLINEAMKIKGMRTEEDVSSGTVSCPKNDARLRPVAQDAAHHAGSACARFQQWVSGILKGNLDANANLQHFIGCEKQAGLTHVDGLAGAPSLLLLQAIAQGNAKLVAQCPRYDCPALTRLFCHARVPIIHIFSVEIFTGPLENYGLPVNFRGSR